MSIRFRVAAVLMFAFGAVAIAPRPARACSYEAGYSTRATLPEDGAVGVPTNARLVVSYDLAAGLDLIFDAGVPHLALTDAAGASVAFRLETARRAVGVVQILVPLAPLVAGAIYQLRDRLSSACYDVEGDDCLSDEATVIATFSVGTGPDSRAPSFDDAIDVDSEFHPGEPGNSCGESSWVFHELSWQAGSDDGPAAWIRYNVYDAAGARLVTLAPASPVAIYERCVGNPDNRGYTVRAVDLAGNENLDSALSVAPSCADFDADGDGEPDGCSAGGGGSGPLVLGAMLLLLLNRARGCPARRRRSGR